MDPLLEIALTIALLLPLVAAAVAVALARSGTLYVKVILAGIAGLYLLALSAFLGMYGAFSIAGGPEGQFLQRLALVAGIVGTAASFLVAMLALRLLSTPLRFAVLFLAPTIVVFGMRAARAWPILWPAITLGPVLCLLVVSVVWVRRVTRTPG